MNTHRRALGGLKWTAIESTVNQLFGLVVFILVARILGPGDFGIVAMAMAVLGFINVLTGLGLNTAIIQSEKLEPSEYNTAFTIAASTGFVGAACLYFSASGVARWFDQPELQGVLEVLAVVPLLKSLGIVQTGRLAREFRFRQLAVRNVLSTIISGTLGISCALAGWGLYSLVAMHVVAALLELILIFFLIEEKPRFQIATEHVSRLLAFGRSIVAFEIVSQYNRKSPVLFAGFFLGSETAGFLSVSIQLLSTMLAVFTQTFNKVAIPYFAKLKSNQRELLHAFYSFTQMAAVVAAPLYIGFAIVAPTFTEVFLGERWSEVTVVMQFVILVGLVQSISFFNGGLLVAMGRPDLRVYAALLRATVGTLLFLVCHLFGIVGMSIAFLLRGLSAEPLQLHYVRWVLASFSIRQYAKNLYRYSGYSLVMAVVIYFARSTILPMEATPAPVSLASQVLIGTTTYVVLLMLFERRSLMRLRAMLG